MIRPRQIGARARLLAQGAPGLTAVAVALVVLLRLPFVGRLAYPDEGGLMVVAAHWHEHGPTLYGSLFVDRPPLLLLFWKLALDLGGLEAARLLVLVAVGALVGAAGWGGHLLGGRRGTACAVLVAAALVANPALGTLEVDAELLGAPLTLLGCVALVAVAAAPAPRRRDDVLAALAGACGAGALLVKQNLADALVFGVVLALTAAVTRTWPWRRALRVLLGGLVGAAGPLGATALWAAYEGPGLRTLWYTLFQFRVDAAAVVLAHPSTHTQHRLLVLLGLTALSGLALVVPSGLWAVRRRLRRGDPVVVAVAAMLGYEVVGVAAGASYWPHYLIELVPGAVLVVAAAAGVARSRARLLGAALAFVAGSAVVAATVAAAGYQPPAHGERAELAGWLRSAGRPGDTAAVTYGHADVLAASGLRPGYPYLWTLPMRTLDPRLDRLVRRLDGRRAPTWVVRWSDLDSWGIDPGRRVQTALDRHYTLAATVCGVPVYLRSDRSRALPPPPPGCAARP